MEHFENPDAVGIDSTATETAENTESRVTTGENGLPIVTLSDGRRAAFYRKHTARDSAYAQDQGKGNAVRLGAALLSRIVTIEGAPTKYDDILDMLQEDYNLLVSNLPGNFTKSTE
jgi:hypothetical protein